jgi:uncharacterized protein YbbC (DUF1343 family)
MDGVVLASRLAAAALPGVIFEPASFTPTSSPGRSSAPKYVNQTVSGVRLAITDDVSFNPLETGIHLLHHFYASQPADARQRFFRKGFPFMAGTSRLQQALVAGLSPEQIISLWQEEVAAFGIMRRPYLLY